MQGGVLRKNNSQVFQHLASRSNGASVVARTLFARDCDRRRKICKGVEFGFIDSLQELPTVGGEALDIATLAFGIERVQR